MNVLATSPASHLDGTQDRSDFVILACPVVHWHLISVRLHPDAGTAVAKHASYYVGVS